MEGPIKTGTQLDDAGAWSALLQSACEQTPALALGVFDHLGQAVRLNLGMRRLLGADGTGQGDGDGGGGRYDDAFSDPCFTDLWQYTGEGRVFEGALSLAGGVPALRRLQVRAWRLHDRLLIGGEPELAEPDRLHRPLIAANRAMARLQGELTAQQERLRSNRTDLARLQRLYAAFGEINSAIRRHTDEATLLRDLCEIAVRFGELHLAWVGTPDGEGNLAARAAAGRTDYLNGLRISLRADCVESGGPAAMAYRSATVQVIENFCASECTAPWHARARQHGIAASAALPLRGATEVLGVLNVYAAEAGYFGENEIRLLDRIADDIALALEALRRASALHEGTERYQRIFDNAPLGLLHYDREGNVIDCNAAYVGIVGSTRAEIVGRNLLRESEDPRVVAAIRQSLTEGSGRLNILYRAMESVKVTPVRAFFSGIRDPSDTIVAGIGIVEDFSERSEMEAQLEASEERFKLAVEAAGIGVWDYSSEHDRLLWDDRMYRLHGIERNGERLDVSAWRRCIHPEDRARVARELLTTNGDHGSSISDYRVIWPNREERHLRTYARPSHSDDGGVVRVTGVSLDITEQQHAVIRVHQLAFFDPLTKLANRRLLMDRLQQAMARSDRQRRFGALLLLDLDGFKRINDTNGHDVGDALLVQLANRLRGVLRRTDTAARLGGDEFVLLCEGLAETSGAAVSGAAATAAKIGAAVREPYRLGADGLVLHCAASIGVTIFMGNETTPGELLKQADIAMYEAKRAGRDAICFFRAEMQQAVDAQAAIEIALRDALACGELRLVYQPQVDRAGCWVGCEALLRWFPSDAPVRLPADFLPLAEAAGLMPTIGDWVLRTALSDMCSLDLPGGSAERLRLAVNVSARQFADNHFAERVLAAVAEARFDPRRLELEVTEGALFSDLDRSVALIGRLRQAGVHVDVDDFGSGSSPLLHLRRLPLAAVKIDQALTCGIDSVPADASIAQAAIGVARALSLPVFAKGIEREAQHQLLLAEGCTRCQGYLFGRPMSVGELRTRWLSVRSRCSG